MAHESAKPPQPVLHESARPCGCDPGHKPAYVCERHQATMAFPFSPLAENVDDSQSLAWCQCLDCGWRGHESELLAEACPRCDGRCADIPTPVSCPSCAQIEGSDAVSLVALARAERQPSTFLADCAQVTAIDAAILAEIGDPIRATSYLVRLRDKETGKLFDKSFDSATERAIYILTVDHWATVEDEWMS